MFQVGKHIEDRNTGARLVIEAVEKDHVLCKVERHERGKAQARAQDGERRTSGNDKPSRE